MGKMAEYITFSDIEINYRGKSIKKARQSVKNSWNNDIYKLELVEKKEN